MDAIEEINGTIERVTFHNNETGFCVLKAKVKNKRDLITIIGTATSITAGELIQATGIWINNKTYGVQFKANQLKIIPPCTKEGIEKYLSSGIVRGIGPHFAKKLIQHFGKDVFDIIEKTPNKLLSLPGIGEKRKDQITFAWKEQKSVRDIMVFLQSHGVGTSRAIRIHKTYGDNAIDIVKENPYRLALDIHGIGFKSADMLAEKMGLTADSIIRARAGVRYILHEFSKQGHCAIFYDKLKKEAYENLSIPESTIDRAIQYEIEQKHFILESIHNQPAIFTAKLYQIEASIAEQLLRLKQKTIPWEKMHAKKVIAQAEEKTGLTLSESQYRAITTALIHKVMIITGGPGVGKTTITKTLLKILMEKGISVMLCAPTGRAAKRLSETTGIQAKTIHRLLDYIPQSHSFKHDKENPLDTDLLIVDETSMLDILLMNHLLQAIPDHAALLLIGDVDQLPSVGPGSLLNDLIHSGTITTITLTEIFRQTNTSNIVVNAHRMNQGHLPLISPQNTPSDFYFISATSPETIHDKLLTVVCDRIPKRFGLNPLTDIQVLTPMNRGGLGTRSLNIILQQALNTNTEPTINQYGSTYTPGDKVIQNINNYDKEVFNGDIGQIHAIDLEDSIVQIDFDGKLITYAFNELDEISLAYAISIHKAQGSEYPAVVIPITMQHYRMLARNLIYTGVTRGKKLVVLIGQQKALHIAVKNNPSLSRLTHLQHRLQQSLVDTSNSLTNHT